MQHTVSILIFPQFRLLDFACIADVFTLANERNEREHNDDTRHYHVEYFAVDKGPIQSSSNTTIQVDKTYRDIVHNDTIIICGGYEGIISHLNDDQQLLNWLVMKQKTVRRLASVCTGAFLLARAGLLNHITAATHWYYAERLKQQYPQINVDGDAIYIKQDNIYTSAGITASIDLCLALLEEDQGHEFASDISRHLVVYLKRPAGQAQYSHMLKIQQQPGRFYHLTQWILGHLTEDLSVAILADKMNMSVRHFSRSFMAATGSTPSKYVENLRVEKARLLLSTSNLSLEETAKLVGFNSCEQMRRSFLRVLKVAPSLLQGKFKSITDQK